MTAFRSRRAAAPAVDVEPDGGTARSSTRGGSATTSRVASVGLALVLVLLAGFALSSAIVNNRRAAEVARASALAEAYRAARQGVAEEESLERKYRLEPVPAIRADFVAAATEVRDALSAVLASGDRSVVAVARDALSEHAVYIAGMRELFAAVDSGIESSVAAIDDAQIEPHYDRIESSVNHAAQLQVERLRVALDRLQRTESLFITLTPFVFVAGFALLATFTWAIRSYRRNIDHQAHHDALTGLANRHRLHDRATSALAAARRTGAMTAMLLLDLDRFKEINDTLGHHYGDLVLVVVGERLRAALRGSDTVARLGGDEYAVLLTQLSCIDDATSVAAKLVDLVKEPIAVGELHFDVEASIGIAVAPAQATTADELIQRADVAMYVAKGSHSGFSVYEPDTDRHSPQRLSMLGDLRRAIDEDQLVLHYQPKNILPDGSMGGVEALVRWNHPDRGLVPPDEFIPLAEHTSLIEPLTDWVLREAMTQARRWADAGYDIPVAVNISTRSLGDVEFAPHVAQLMRECDIPGRLLEFEVTESAIMADPDRARRVLHDLSLLGVRISIDDFGTGYSSLAYLRTLPVHALKIDRSFVSSMQRQKADAVIVRSVIELAHNLGLDVIAEGVEDADTAADLVRHGCTIAQGYYWSRPVPAEQLLSVGVARAVEVTPR